jgi:prepilin-type N-terminal cleavage/methylation domain-containing protein
MKSQTGITLTEVMIVLAIIGISSTVAIPNIQAMLANNQITAKTNDLIGSISFIKNESITRPSMKWKIQKLSTWGKGWIITGGDIPKTFNYEDQVLINIKEPSSTTSISFRSRGRAKDKYEIYLCSRKHPQGRHITVKKNGYISTKRCPINSCTGNFTCS